MVTSFESIQQEKLIEFADSVVLTPAIASRIVERSAESLTSLAITVSVTRRPGVIVASSEPDRVGAQCTAAVMTMQTGRVSTSVEGSGAAVASPLVYDDEVVGAVVLHGDPLQGAAAIRITRTLAELLIHQMTVIDRLGNLEHRRSRFIEDVLLGRLETAGDMERGAALVGVDLTIPRVVVAVRVDTLLHQMQPPSTADSLPMISRERRTIRVRAQLVEWARPRARCGPDDLWGIVEDHWLVLLARIDAASPDADHDEIKRRCVPLVRDLVATGDTDACAGIGRYHPGPSGLAASFADARFAAVAGCRLVGPADIVSIDDLGLAGFVGEVEASTKRQLVDRILAPLLADPALLETTSAFLEHNLSPLATAAALHIHRHTLAYRLGKVARLTGLDPRRFEHAVQLHAALLIRQFSPDTIV